MPIPDNGSRDAFETGAVRDVTTGKPRPTLLPPSVYERLAQRATEGAAKYDDHNWAKGIPLSRYADAIQRHLWAELSGDDSEDHLGAIMWNAGAFAWTKEQIAAGNLPDSLDDLVDWSVGPETSHPGSRLTSWKGREIPVDLMSALDALELDDFTFNRCVQLIDWGYYDTMGTSWANPIYRICSWDAENLERDDQGFLEELGSRWFSEVIRATNS